MRRGQDCTLILDDPMWHMLNLNGLEDGKKSGEKPFLRVYHLNPEDVNAKALDPG